MPVAFRDEPYAAHQRIYFALDEMKLIETMHRKVFAAIHADRQRLDKPADIAAFMTKNGVDGAKFLEFYNGLLSADQGAPGDAAGPGLQDRRRAGDGRPGQVLTSASLAGSHERALAVVDFLIQKERGKA